MIGQEKILYSGMQPTGNLTLGNFIGALNNWIKLEKEYTTFLSVVDQHSITVRQNAADLRNSCRRSMAIYIASGLDPVKNCIYFQSHVPAHAQLAWILNCYTYIGELQRMTQFKDKSSKNADNLNAGLLTYPVLMAADILLFQTDIVPVGADQKQHVELCRTIANRFNNIYGDVFTIPEHRISKVGAKVMSLQEPTKKMSKSDENINASIYILDSKDDIIRKFKKAVTDSDAQVRYDPENKPGVSNLMTIYSVSSKKNISDIEKEFENVGYGEFKIAVGESVYSMLKPLQDKYNDIMNDKSYLDNIMKTNAEKAAYYANRTLRKVEKKIGFAVK